MSFSPKTKGSNFSRYSSRFLQKEAREREAKGIVTKEMHPIPSIINLLIMLHCKEILIAAIQSQRGIKLLQREEERVLKPTQRSRMRLS